MCDMSSYDELRQQYRPEHIKLLLVAESPPPSENIGGSRHFYRSAQPRREDRLFNNTIWALYPAASEKTEDELQAEKESWLRRLQADGVYMIEALEISQAHKVEKKDRQARIKEALPRLIERVGELAEDDTRLVLVKSNVFVAAAEPLRAAGFTVLNTALVDYPGHYNQQAYKEKLSRLARESGWSPGKD